MTTHTTPWPAGTPCWVDIMVPDLERAQAFYREVLGWSYSEARPEFGNYVNGKVGDGVVAGLCPTMPGMEDAPARWTVYLATDDLAATDASAREHGARQVAEPMQVGPFGSMALWADPGGALVGAWQSAEHTGFEVVEEPGAPAWADLMTGDAAAARDFYAQVFGFSYSDAGMGEMDYHLFSVPGGERPAGGLGAVDSDEDYPGGWSVCFSVADVDEMPARVGAAGGTVTMDPYDFPYGRLVHVTGPDGEPFVLLSPPKEG